MENHFPEDVIGVVRNYLYGEKNKKNYTHDNVIKEIEWLRNIYMTKIMRPNDPLVRNMSPPLPQKLHIHFCIQIAVQYMSRN